MADSAKPNCTRCHGRGSITENVREPDTTMSLALGTAMGIGLFPSYRTVTEKKTCPTCGGSGKQR